ncbi:hypothetical protein [Crossiella cryophila]|uniref:hypothetical protein n=1 Tax=Crossiella cryophila TaxID=43355 RepID=UPI001C8855DC|nr:hypothetical protein [Crossiella cryophila]
MTVALVWRHQGEVVTERSQVSVSSATETWSTTLTTRIRGYTVTAWTEALPDRNRPGTGAVLQVVDGIGDFVRGFHDRGFE